MNAFAGAKAGSRGEAKERQTMASMTPPLTHVSRAAWGHLLRAAIDVSLRVSGPDATHALLASLCCAPTQEEYPSLTPQRAVGVAPPVRERSFSIRTGGRWADALDEDDDEDDA